MYLEKIIEDLPKLTANERRAIYRYIEELDGEQPRLEVTEEMLAAIDKATRSLEAGKGTPLYKERERFPFKWAIEAPEAQQDLTDIIASIAQKDPDAAEKCRMRLIGDLQFVNSFRTLGRRVPGRDDERVLEVDGQILIFYHIDAGGIQFKRLWHRARRIN